MNQAVKVKTNLSLIEVEKKPHQVEKKPHQVEKKPLIKNLHKKNFIKKSSYGKNIKSKILLQYKKENKKKIFKFLNENEKTKDLCRDGQKKLLKKLETDIKNNGGFKGVKLTSTVDHYLSQEHYLYGRTIDKIIERYYYSIEEIERDNAARNEYLEKFKKYYPDKIKNILDYSINKTSMSKLEQLISKSPSIYYWSDRFIYHASQIKNPKFNKLTFKKAKRHMDKLIFQKTKGKKLSIEKQGELIKNFLPIVEKKYSIELEFIHKRNQLPFSDFCKERKVHL